MIFLQFIHPQFIHNYRRSRVRRYYIPTTQSWFWSYKTKKKKISGQVFEFNKKGHSLSNTSRLFIQNKTKNGIQTT